MSEAMLEVPASEFAKRFSRYRMAAQKAPVAVTHHGRVTEVLTSKADHDDYLRLKAREPKAYYVWELPDHLIEAIKNTKMDPKYDYLNAVLDEDEA